MTKLFREAIRHNINGLVKIVSMIFRVNIRPRQSKMNLDHKGMFESALIVMPESYVRPDQSQTEMLQTIDFLSNIGMNRRGKLDVTRTNMDLHISSYSQL